MGASLNATGMDEIMTWAENTGNNVNKAIDPALKAGAAPILADLKATTAYKDKSGRTRKAMKMSNVKTRRGQKYIQIGDVDGKAPAFRLLEFGTSKMRAYPSLRPAIDNNQEESYRRIRVKIREAIGD